MTDRQSQNLNKDAVGVQSGRDTNIGGLSAEQMASIMAEIRETVKFATEQAREIIEERQKNFENRIIIEFAEGGRGNSSAFEDPDFQYVLRDAQTTFARSGDKNLENVLVDLISERSLVSGRSRVKLSLNDAIEKSKALTKEDFANLTLIFLFRNFSFNGPLSLQGLIGLIEKYYLPVFRESNISNFGFKYLGSHNCINLLAGGLIVSHSAYKTLEELYPMALTKGVPKSEMKNTFPEDHPLWVYGKMQKSYFGGDRYLCSIQTEAQEIDFIEQTGIPISVVKEYRRAIENHILSESQFLGFCGELGGEISGMFESFDNNFVMGSELTSIGLTLAHARMSQNPDFALPLSDLVG